MLGSLPRGWAVCSRSRRRTGYCAGEHPEGFGNGSTGEEVEDAPQVRGNENPKPKTETAEFGPLFNGKNKAGWKADGRNRGD